MIHLKDVLIYPDKGVIMYSKKRIAVHTPLGTRYNWANLKKHYSTPWVRYGKKDKWFRVRNIKNRKVNGPVEDY